MAHLEKDENTFMTRMNEAFGVNISHGFSPKGLSALFEYIHEACTECDDRGFNPVEIVGDWAEYESAEAALRELQVPLGGLLGDYTPVIDVGNGRVIVNR